MAWLIQVKYRRPAPAQAPDGWVTVGIAEDMRAAARHAAFEYRDRNHPSDGYPDQLRIRSEDQLRRDGGDMPVTAASDSLRAFGELTA